MRAVLAAALALTLAIAAAAPHVHVEPHGGEACAACLVRGGSDVARSETPALDPLSRPAGEVLLLPAPSPVCGAPLGAVPGQSPPDA